jgi:DNA adenine methylase
MKYMGSKARFAKEILPIILKDRQPEQWYVEPFCGGLGTMQYVTGKRIAADKNRYLIAMWQGLQKNTPRVHEISKSLYDIARFEYNRRINNQFTDFEIGWIGFMASFNGRFYDGGYSGSVGKRDYVREQINNTEKQIQEIVNFKDIKFVHSDYYDLEIPEKSIIYCDIPYIGTKQYSVSKSFDHDKFWNWCRIKKEQGHVVFFSEYQAPSDFDCFWQKQITNSMHQKNTKITTEKLFTLK